MSGRGTPRSSSPPRANVRGFTLLELLAIVAIILLLVSLLLPALSRARSRGDEMKCLSNLRQWGTYWTLYGSDHDGKFMNGWVVDGTYIGWHRGAWLLDLKSYYSDQMNLIRCPVALEPNVVNGKATDYGGVKTTFKHGVTLGPGYERGSYGLNVWAYDPPTNLTAIQAREVEKHWRGFGSIGRPNQVPLFLDCMWRGAGPDYDQTLKIEPPNSNGEWVGYDAEMRHAAIDRHRGGSQMVFMNGAARKVGLKEIWALKWHGRYDPKVAYRTSWPAWMSEYKEYTP